MGIWRGIFGWKALFRWDALGVIVPGIFIAVGVGVLSVDWFPYHLLIAQICFAVAALLCVIKFVGHAIESEGTLVSRWLFGIMLTSIVIALTIWVDYAIQVHKDLLALTIQGPPLTPPNGGEMPLPPQSSTPPPNQPEKSPPKATKPAQPRSTTTPSLPQPQPQTEPQTVINAPGGIGISGGRVTNPTVNNFAPPQRTVSEEQLDNLRQALGGSTGKVSSNCPMADDEGCSFAESIREAFESAGWTTGPHVGLTAPTGKKQPFVFVELVDPFHPSLTENLVITGLKSMSIPVIAGHGNDARGDDVPIFIDASIVPVKPQ